MSSLEPRTQNPEHEIYLKRCFELAQKGETLAFPNPIVGCVIVHDGEIIAEGFHKKFGEAHAEVNAINHALERYSFTALEEIFKKSDIYISLEPCAHHGKTPPCADLIIKKGFKRLIFSSYDPNPEVSGLGIARIKEAGIELIEAKDLDSELKKESDYLNRKFFHKLKSYRPWLSLKIALTENGEMTSEGKWITNTKSRKDVHRLRSTSDLIVSGANSIQLDNSRLNVRFTAEELNLADIKNPDIAIFYREKKLDEAHEIFKIDSNRNVFQTDSLDKLLEYNRILIESGPSLSDYFINSGELNEVIIYQRQVKDKTNQDWQEKLKSIGFGLYKKKTLEADGQVDLKEIWITSSLRELLC